MKLPVLGRSSVNRRSKVTVWLDGCFNDTGRQFALLVV
jgi:hypothetical protein